MRKNLVLLGMMGVGKTTLGKIVAKKLKLDFVDTDTNIEKKYSMKIYDIFKKKGESFFRKEEENEVLKSIKKKNCIVALGGGAFINKNVREAVLKNTKSIWLDDSLKTIDKRTRWKKNRPLLDSKNNNKTISKLYIERKNIYKLANYKIYCNNLDKESIVKKIINFYENH